MSALTVALLSILPLAQVSSSAAPEAAPAPERATTPSSPVVLGQEDTPPVRLVQKQRRRAEREPPKNRFLDLFWRVFPPPGDYTMEVGLSAGANYMETAYGGTNPNVIFRGQFAMRPMPGELPLFAYGVLDYTDYQQSAGDLFYNSRSSLLGVGGGLLHWIGPLRLDLAAEVGGLMRITTQGSDDFDPITRFHAQPAAGLIAGGGLGLLGHVAFSMRAGVRAHGWPARVDYMVLYGIEWMIDAKPYDYY